MSDFELPRNAPPPGTPRPGQGLAITALVLACLFFVPLLPLIGLILGIVALVKSRPGDRGLAIAAVVVGGVTLVMNVGVCAAVAIPSFMKYVKRSKTSEARMNIGRLATSVAAYQLDHNKLPPPADWTPPGRACDQPNQKFSPDPSLWKGEPWKSLDFSVDTPSYYQYRVVAGADGVTVEARGDLDCDGEFSSFRRTVSNDGHPQPIEVDREME